MGRSYRSSNEKHEGMRLYPIPKLLREDNIKIELKEVGGLDPTVHKRAQW